MPNSTGTATPQTNPEQANNEQRATNLANLNPDCDYDLNQEAASHPATLMVRIQGSESVDAVGFTCSSHARFALEYLNFGDHGDALDILKFEPR